MNIEVHELVDGWTGQATSILAAELMAAQIRQDYPEAEVQIWVQVDDEVRDLLTRPEEELPQDGECRYCDVETSCATCAGSGVIDANHFGDRMMIEPCVTCYGTGRVPTPENVESCALCRRRPGWSGYITGDGVEIPCRCRTPENVDTPTTKKEEQ